MVGMFDHLHEILIYFDKWLMRKIMQIKKLVFRTTPGILCYLLCTLGPASVDMRILIPNPRCLNRTAKFNVSFPPIAVLFYEYHS